jgi:hypothetical protein
MGDKEIYMYIHRVKLFKEKYRRRGSAYVERIQVSRDCICRTNARE